MISKDAVISAVFGLMLMANGAAEGQTTQDPSVVNENTTLPPVIQPDPAKPKPFDPNQTDPGKANPVQPDAKKAGSGAVDNALQLAVKQNPEIRLKEHGVRTAELELDATKQRVLGRVAETYADYQAVLAIYQEVQRRLQTLKKLAVSGKGVALELEFGEANVTVAKYQGEVKRKEAELASLCGNSIKDPLPQSLENSLAAALKKNPEIRLKEYAIRTAELQLQIGQDNILHRIDELKAELNGTQAILTEVQRRLQTLLRLRGLQVSDLEIGETQVVVTKFEAEQIRQSLKLDALMSTNVPALENTPEQALKQNAEILLKEHGVRTAELEHNVTTQRVLGKVTETYADYQAVLAIFQEVQKRLQKLQRLAAGGKANVVSELEMGEAEVMVAKYQGEVKHKEAELALLCGVSAKDSLPQSLENAVAAALKKNPDIRLKEHAIRTAELELQIAQQNILRRINELKADFKGTEAILAEVQRRHQTLLRLREGKSGVVSELEIGDSEVTVVKYNAEAARKKAELDALMGVNMPSPAVKEAPPILKTYAVTGNAEAIVKTLQVTYKTSSALRVQAIGEKQIMVYAPAPIQMEIVKYLEPMAPQIKTLPVGFEHTKAEAMAAPLWQWFKANAKDVGLPTMSVDAKTNTLLISGDAQQISLAKLALKELAKEPPAVANAAKIRKALEMPVIVDYSGLTMKDVLGVLQEQLLKTGHTNINLVDKSDGQIQVNYKLAQPVPLAGVLQLLEDQYGMIFFFRDYGIVGVNGGTIPPGAILVSDFVKRGPEKEAPPKSK